MTSNARGQSETIGMILLTGVIVVVAVVAGGVMVTKVNSQAATTPLLEIDVNATTQEITIAHAGGDRLDTDDIDVVLRGDSTVRYPLGSFSQVTGEDATRFEPGDEWQRVNDVGGGQVEVLLVHRPSNSIVDSQTVPVTVTIAARFSYSPSDPTPASTVTFDASGSTVKDSTIASYEWDFDDDGVTDDTGETIDYTFSDDGEYPVTLTVTADDGRVANRTKTMTVYNELPTAGFTYTPSSPDPGEQVSFDGSGSSDPDGTIDSYDWNFGDENTGTGETTTHTYSSEGNYTVRLEVTDDDGDTRPTSKVVSVESASAPDVTITATSISSTGNSGQYDVDITFEASDPDGDITNYTAYLYNSSSQTTELDNVSSTNYDGTTTTVTLNDESTQEGESPLYVLVKVRDSTGKIGNDSATVGSSANQVLEFQKLTKGKNGEVNFDVRNTGDESVTVTEFAVDASAIQSNAELKNGDSAEVKIDSTDRANSGPYDADGTRYDLDSNATIDDGSEVNVILKQIEGPGEGNSDLGFELEQVETIADADVIVTLGLEDGQDQKFYFEDVSGQGNSGGQGG